MTKPSRTIRADGDATRKRLLEHAGELFAASGFAETTGKAIAIRAEADLASINYHFGSRAGLYTAVLAEAHRQIVDIEDLRRIAALRLPARDKLRLILKGLVAAAKSPESWHARVLGREILSPSSHFQTLEQQEIRPKLEIILSILGEITGIPFDDPALIRCLVSVGAPCMILIVAGPRLAAPAQQVIMATQEELVEHLYGFALGGLEAIARQRGGGVSPDGQA